MKLRVGLVGLGEAWKTRHGPALRALGDRFEVRAICDQIWHRANLVAQEFNATAVDGFQALARRADVDAILMLSTQWSGALPLFAACEAGKAVYCAADWNIPSVEARRIKQRVERSGVAFSAELPRRQTPATIRLKELIATRLGAPRLLFCHQRLALPRRGATDHENSSAGHDQATHGLMELIDWCHYVVGRPSQSVMGLCHFTDGKAEQTDYDMFSLDFAEDESSGTDVVAHISQARYIDSDWPEAIAFRRPSGLQVSCEHGIAFIDLPATIAWFDKAGRHLETLDSERPANEFLLAQFHRSVTSLVRNTKDLHDVYRALLTVQAARDSQREGSRIQIQD